MNNKPEQHQIDHWIKSAFEGIKETEDDLRNGFYEKENISIQSVHTGTALFYATLGRSKFLNENPIEEVREQYALAGGYVLKSFKMAYDESDPDFQGGNSDWSSVSETWAIRGMNNALIAGDFKLASEMAFWFQDRHDGYNMGFPVYSYSHAFAETIMNNHDKAGKLLNDLTIRFNRKPPNKGYRKNYYTLTLALSGIHERNEKKINMGLTEQLKVYQGYAKGEAKDTSYEFICDFAVALANLGIKQGLNVTVDHYLLPKGLLIKQE